MKSLVEDKSFALPLESTRLAHEVAMKFILWIPSNMPRARAVEEELTGMMLRCFGHNKKKQASYRELMWSLYHTLRTSSEYICTWKRVTKEVTGKESCPASFFQYVGHFMFKELIKIHHVMKLSLIHI